MRGDASAIALGTVLCLSLSACKGGSAPPPPPPPPPPVVTSASFDVAPCLVQNVTPGQTVASLVVPDTLTMDFTRPPAFPNGRQLADPVIDETLAMLFLDLTKHSIMTFHDIGLNPPGNDKPYRADFPYLAPPWGNLPVPAGDGNFNFRTDPASAYVRVDRTGMPAISTALISGPNKIAYNDDSPVDDATFKWVPELKSSLTALTNALADDLDKAGLNKCAKPEPAG